MDQQIDITKKNDFFTLDKNKMDFIFDILGEEKYNIFLESVDAVIKRQGLFDSIKQEKYELYLKGNMDLHMSGMREQRKPACKLYTKYAFFYVPKYDRIEEYRRTISPDSFTPTIFRNVLVRNNNPLSRITFIFSISPDDNQQWLNEDLGRRKNKFVDDANARWVELNVPFPDIDEEHSIKKSGGLQFNYEYHDNKATPPPDDLVKEIPLSDIWVVAHKHGDEILWAYCDRQYNEHFMKFTDVYHLINPTKLYWIDTYYSSTFIDSLPLVEDNIDIPMRLRKIDDKAFYTTEEQSLLQRILDKCTTMNIKSMVYNAVMDGHITMDMLNQLENMLINKDKNTYNND